jgi:hypothetical protein
MVRALAETDTGVIPLEVDAFADEATLQGLLARFPELVLAGRGDDERPKIWTIGLEVAVPSGAVDLVLLDATGRVWVVETKLAKNPEVRKHVVGQVLAYASDIATWTADDISTIASRHLDGRELADLIDESLGEGKGEEVIERTADRLAAGNLTSLIVVDDFNSVLRRLVEFVNRHATFELLAMQVQVITHEGRRLFFPTTVGEMSRQSSSKTSDGMRYSDLIGDAAPETVELEKRLDALADEQGWVATVGAKSKGYGLSDGGFLFRLYPQWALLEFYFQRLSDEPELAAPLRAAMETLAGRELPAKHPGLNAAEVLDEWDRVVAEVLIPYAEAVAAVRQD